MDYKLSITTDYLEDTGNPEPYLKKISETGFTHIHWCHEWNTDHLYSRSEINNIKKLLNKYKLQVLDLHALKAIITNLASENETKRKLGIKLTKNRIWMANKLSSETIILHFTRERNKESTKKKYWDMLHKSMNELKPYAKKYNVRIALENYFNNENGIEIEKLFTNYDSNFLGLCYDSGHGNISTGIPGLALLEKFKDRLISVHLNGNDGKQDQHKLLFTGSIEWNKLAHLIAKSSYTKCVSMEVSMKNSDIVDESLFLKKAYQTGIKFSKMINKYKKLS